MSFSSWLRSRKSALPRLALGRPPRRCAKRCPTRRLVLEALEDRCLPSTFTVLNTNDASAGSLRQAILDANAHANVGGPYTIAFVMDVTDSNHLYYTDDSIAGKVSRANVAGTTAASVGSTGIPMKSLRRGDVPTARIGAALLRAALAHSESQQLRRRDVAGIVAAEDIDGDAGV